MSTPTPDANDNGHQQLSSPPKVPTQVPEGPLDAIRWPVSTDRLTRAPANFEEHRAGFEDPASLAKTVIIEREGQVIGDLMLQIEDGWAQAEVAEQARRNHAELGWVIHPAFAGHGYATEAVAELLRLCFIELGLRRVTANCFAGNIASWRLMERLGMRRELHAVRESLHRSGQWLDIVGYAMLADEWHASP